MDSDTSRLFATEAAMALSDGASALIERRGKPTLLRGRPPSGDWHLAGWVAAICLHRNIAPTEAEGPFTEVMTAVWHAVGESSLPTHAVRTMLAKIKAGIRTVFPVAHGVSYWLFGDGVGKPRVIFGLWKDTVPHLLASGAQGK